MKLVVVLVALLAAVSAKKGFGPGEQDWGYAEVRPGAHVFWWLYYSTATDVIAPEDKPLVIWLQGGPGASGTGNFKESIHRVPLMAIDLFRNLNSRSL